jgi:hypothetical protein
MHAIHLNARQPAETESSRKPLGKIASRQPLAGYRAI